MKYLSARLLTVSSLMLAACGDGENVGGGDGSTLDTGAAIGDSGSGTGTDGGTDPFAAEPTCTTGSMWTRGNRGSSSMNPGQACIACHQATAQGEPAAFRMTIGGTVYPTGHEPDNCNGPAGTGVQVVVTDANNTEVVMTPNGVGNFSSTRTLTFPITAVVRSSAGERAMLGSVSTGDCNSCHTQNGAQGAPGRIVTP